MRTDRRENGEEKKYEKDEEVQEGKEEEEEKAAAELEWMNLVFDPPQQKLDCNDTNSYTWPDSTPEEETALYRSMWKLLSDQEGPQIMRELLKVLRDLPHPMLPVFIGGNVPLNYYLTHRYHAPHAVPSNDLDLKVDIGEYLRKVTYCPSLFICLTVWHPHSHTRSHSFTHDVPRMMIS